MRQLWAIFWRMELQGVYQPSEFVPLALHLYSPLLCFSIIYYFTAQQVLPIQVTFLHPEYLRNSLTIQKSLLYKFTGGIAHYDSQWQQPLREDKFNHYSLLNLYLIFPFQIIIIKKKTTKTPHPLGFSFIKLVLLLFLLFYSYFFTYSAKIQHAN